MAEREDSAAQWFVLWTHSHCEQLVHDQLAGNGFDVFLPTIKTWSRQKGVRRAISVPMFPGYAFVNHAMDKWSYTALLKTRGLVRILGERWDRLEAVPAAEIEAIRRVAAVDAPVMPHPYLRQGQRVRIVDGPLIGVEGILVQVKPSKGLLVLSVDLLRQSVALEVDCTVVVPVSDVAAYTQPIRSRVASFETSVAR